MKLNVLMGNQDIFCPFNLALDRPRMWEGEKMSHLDFIKLERRSALVCNRNILILNGYFKKEDLK